MSLEVPLVIIEDTKPWDERRTGIYGWCEIGYAILDVRPFAIPNREIYHHNLTKEEWVAKYKAHAYVDEHTIYSDLG